jgi:hypothetical protein
MSYHFRPATREQVGLLIGLAGPSGSGKTFSAMTMAKGIVGPSGRFAVIDTENKRSRHYAEYFNFDVVDIVPPYRPETYTEAIKAAIEAGYKAIVVDSMTHEHSGEGGVLEWQHDNLQTLVKRAKEREPSTPEWKLEERLGPKSWIEPKTARKKAIQQMLFASTSIPVIVCFRAEEKLLVKKVNGKTEMVTEWMPACGKEYPFEMTCFFMLSCDKPGIPQPIKLQEQHKALFPLDKPINEESGRRIAEWAGGSSSQFISEDQRRKIVAAMGQTVKPADLFERFKLVSTGEILAEEFDEVIAWIADMKQAA